MSAPRRLTWLLAILLAVAAAWNVSAVVDFDFVAMDDDINIYVNPNLGPPTPTTLHWMFTDATYMRRYIPLGWLTFSLVYTFSGLSPFGYHLANLALHVVNTLLLFAVLLRTLRRWGRHTDESWLVACAALAAGLWALHPFRAETIGWSSGLLYGPAGAAALLSVWCYLHALESRHDPRSRLRWLLLTAFTYLLSLLVYPIALGLLGLFVVMDWADWHYAPATAPASPPPTFNLRRYLAEKLLLALPGMVVLAVTVLASVNSRSFWEKPATLDEFGWLPRAAQAAYAWAAYLWHRWWPVDLTPAPTRLLDFKPSEPIFWLSALALFAITIALCARRKWRRGPLALWLGFFVLIAPMLGFMERPYFPTDRYDYLPGMIVSTGFALLLLRMSARWRSLAAFVSLAGLGLFAWCQHTQLPIWRNTDTLKQRTISASGSFGFRVMEYRGLALFHAHRGEKALALQALAECERACGPGRWLEGMRHDIDTAASSAALHTHLAIDFSRAGRSREAREHFQAALHLEPALASAGISYAVLCAIEDEPFDALHWYLQAVALSPQDVPSASRRRVLPVLADAFARTGHPALAVRTIELALREPGPAPEMETLRQQLTRFQSLPRP